jgi:type 1 fimbriae regulatory protein FimB/type 1 fimbriae regulatory protein FimE
MLRNSGIEKNEKLPFRRPKNADVRTREHLTKQEVYKIAEAAKALGRHRWRDYWCILFLFKHALRVSELCNLRWHDVDLDRATIFIRRAKAGDSCTQPLSGDELRALRRFKRATPHSAWVFSTERSTPLSPRNVQLMVARAGEAACIGFPVHPHMLRHACGYTLINNKVPVRAIQAYLGHKNLQTTVLYTRLDEQAFAGIDKLL